MVNVIIVNYDSERELRDCVASVQRQRHVRSICVRNTGRPVKLPGVTTVNGKNVGYGAACNEQAKHGGGKYLLFLNADIVLPDDAVEKTVAMLESHGDAGICGIAMENQAVSMAFPTLTGLMERSICRRRVYAKAEQNKSGYTDWVLGAFLLVRREAFYAVGGFDPGFFLYFEETDLARRMLDAGWRCLYCADTTAKHAEGSSAAKPFSVEQYAKSRLRYARKHFSPFSAALLAAVVALAEPAARFVQTGSLRCAAAPWRGLR